MKPIEKWQPPKDIKPWIVCAANKNRANGYIVCGARHWDNVMQKQIAVFYDTTVKSRGKDWEQGFIDQWGRFYNRKDAMKAVKESGQPFNAERNSGNGDILFSEGLY